jgi:tRNA G46 methylase TrmB
LSSSSVVNCASKIRFSVNEEMLFINFFTPWKKTRTRRRNVCVKSACGDLSP